MDVNLIKTGATVLKTEGKFCAENINVIPTLQQKEVSENGEYTPDSGYAGLSKVTVNVASGASLNVAYGDSAPSDTTKLWIEGAEPEKISLTNKFCGSESLTLYDDKVNNVVRAARLGNYVYVGIDQSTNIYKYDLINKTYEWLGNSNFADGRHCDFVMIAKNDKIYYLGGRGYDTSRSKYVSSNTALIYDPAQNSWSSFSHGYSRHGCVTVAVDDQFVYMLGGYSTGASTSNPTKAGLKVDLVNQTYQLLGDILQTGTAFAGYDMVGNDIYIFGGTDGTNIFNTVQKFNVPTHTTTTLDVTMPQTIRKMTAKAVGTDIYIFGGYNGVETVNTIYKFDTVTQTFSTVNATMIEKLFGMDSVVVDNHIYLFGGNDNTQGRYLIQDFLINQPLDSSEIVVLTNQNNNMCKIINSPQADISIGITGVYRGNENNSAVPQNAYLYSETGGEWIKI